MAYSATWQHAGLSNAAERQRRRLVFQAIRRHSRVVRRLRILLPIAGTLIVLAFVVVTRFALPENIDLSVARLSVTRNSIIMDHPHLTGFDASNRQYSVEADRAIQQLSSPDQVRLETITAKVAVPGQGTATIRAGIGDYNNKERTLKLRGGIALDTSEGYALRMTDADIDFHAGTMASANPVTVSYQDSRTTGERLSVTGGGRIFVLDGGVRTTLMPPKRAQAGAAAQE